MIVDDKTREAIKRRKMRCRMMRLPVEQGPLGERLPCPLAYGRAYKLQAGVGIPADVTITVSRPVRREKLGAITLKDAKQEGHPTIVSAVKAWERRHGEAHPHRWVWVVAFVEGDASESFAQDTSLFLAKGGGYTTMPARQAVPGDPEIIDPEAVARFTREARERQRETEDRAIRAKAGEVETLRDSIKDMKRRSLIRKAARDLKAAAALVPSDATVDSGAELFEPGAQAKAPTSSAASTTRLLVDDQAA